MSYTILIYSFVPENLKVFKVPDEVLSIADDDMLTLAHGKMINRDSDQAEAMEYVYAMVSEVPPEASAHLEFESSRKVIGKLVPYLVYSEEGERERNVRVDCEVSRIVYTGFLY